MNARVAANIKVGSPALHIGGTAPEVEEPAQLFDLPKAKESVDSIASDPDMGHI